MDSARTASALQRRARLEPDHDTAQRSSGSHPFRHAASTARRTAIQRHQSAMTRQRGIGVLPRRPALARAGVPWLHESSWLCHLLTSSPLPADSGAALLCSLARLHALGGRVATPPLLPAEHLLESRRAVGVWVDGASQGCRRLAPCY